MGIGGAGMSAIASVLRGHGPRGDRHRPARSAGRGAPAVARHHRRGRSRAANVADADVVTSRRPCRRTTPSWSPPGPRGIPVCPGPRCWPPSAPAAAASPWPAPTARRRRPRCSRSILVEAGMRPSFVIGADVNEIGTNAVWDTGEWLVVEADESYGTFQPPGARPGRADQRRGGPPGPLRYLRRPARGVRRLRGRRPTSGWSAPTTPRRPPSDGPSGRTGGDVGGRHVRHGRHRAARSSVRSTCVGPTARWVARLQVAVPGPPQRPERRGGRGGGPGGRGAVRGGGQAAGPVRRGDPPLRVPRRAGGVTFVDDYAHLPTEVRRRPGDGPQRGLGPGRGRVPTPPLHTDGRAGRGSSATAFDDADVLVVTDIYSAGEPPVPGVSGRLVADAVRAQRPGRRAHYVPGGPSCRRPWARCSARATSA